MPLTLSKHSISKSILLSRRQKAELLHHPDKVEEVGINPAMGGGDGGGGLDQDLNVAGGDIREGAEGGGLCSGVPNVEAYLGHGDLGDDGGGSKWGTRAELLLLFMLFW